MTTTRRGFLRTLGYGLVGGLALAHVPTAALRAVGLGESARYYCCEKLRAIVNEHYRRHGLSRPIQRIAVGRQFYDTLESEMIVNVRFTAYDEPFESLLFKGHKVCPTLSQPWGIRLVV